MPQAMSVLQFIISPIWGSNGDAGRSVYVIVQGSRLKQFIVMHLSNKQDTSRISIFSKKNNKEGRDSPSTDCPNSPTGLPRQVEFPSYQDGFRDSDSMCLQRQVERMEKEQEEMEERFRRCLEGMLAQIQRNNEGNAKLAQEVSRLRSEVSENQRDILMIEDFIKAKGKHVDSGNKLARPRQIVRGLSKRTSSKDLFSSLSSSKTLLKVRSPVRPVDKKVSVHS